MVIFNKLPTYYAVGTATVAANGTAVAGTGTDWTALQPGDLFGVHKGLSVPIASVNSATSITLLYGWPGAAQTNATYCVQLTPRSVGVQEATRQLLLMLGNGNLDSFANLTGTENAIPMFSGAGVLTTLASSTIGRDLLTALNSTAAYGVLGAIPEAQLPTRLRAVSSSVTNIDTAIDSGDYTAAATATGHPTGSGVFGFSTIYINTTTQIQIGSTAGNVWYTRAKSSGTWGAWGRLPNFGTDNIIPDASLPTRLRELSPAVTNADTIMTNGYYAVAPTASNIPEAVAGTLIVSMYTASTYGVQIYVRLSSSANNIWYRARSNGNWLPWKRMDGDLSGPGAAVTNNALVGFNGTTGYLTKALTTLEALANLGPVLGGVAPEPAAAGVGMSNGDFDTVIFPGVYTLAGQWANGPNGAAASGYVGILEVQARSYNNLYVQIVRLNNGVVHKRYGGSGPAWNAWGQTEDASTAASRALLALTPAADRLPYFNGASSAALTVLTSFGRSLIGAADTAALSLIIGAREKLSSNRNYYVRTGGSNSNNGLTNTDAGAFATLQYAYDFVAKNLDLNGFSVTINMADGYHTTGLNASIGLTGGNVIFIRGNVTTPGNCFLEVTNSHGILNTVRDLTINVGGIRLSALTAGTCLWASGGNIELGANCLFAPAANGDHFLATDGGNILISANYSVAGGCVNHWHAYGQGQITCQGRTITISSAISMTRWCGVATALLTSTGCTFTGKANVSGATYLVHRNGVVIVEGAGTSYFPGNAAGTVQTGGQYI